MPTPQLLPIQKQTKGHHNDQKKRISLGIPRIHDDPYVGASSGIRGIGCDWRWDAGLCSPRDYDS